MKYSFKHKISSVLILGLLPGLIHAASKDSTDIFWSWVLNNILFIMSGAVIVGVILSLSRTMNAIFRSTEKELLREQGVEVEEHKPSESFISKLYKKAWNLVPIERESDIDLGHDYDGIRELDNSLPPWWLYGFYFTIFVSVIYMYVYHFSDIGNSQLEEYEIAMEIGERQRELFEERQANTIDLDNLIPLTDQESLDIGHAQFLTNCSVCHGAEGQGGVGPNLTDSYWLHGGSISSIFKTIKYGVPDKGMTAWKSQLQPATIHKVASYIKTLKGTNPPNPKKKEGVLYEEETVDSTAVNNAGN